MNTRNTVSSVNSSTRSSPSLKLCTGDAIGKTNNPPVKFCEPGLRTDVQNGDLEIIAKII